MFLTGGMFVSNARDRNPERKTFKYKVQVHLLSLVNLVMIRSFCQNFQAFQTYDASGDGSMNIEELRKTLKAVCFL